MVGHMLFFHFESALVGLETLPVGFDRADAVEFKDISLSCFASRLNFVRCFAKEPTDNFLSVPVRVVAAHQATEFVEFITHPSRMLDFENSYRTGPELD